MEKIGLVSTQAAHATVGGGLRTTTQGIINWIGMVGSDMARLDLVGFGWARSGMVGTHLF